ncbi:uncharacterized protein LOC124984967 [Sciurus carolinensis]|uniref:uncharacterized protein LOC124984967 n=1 Tax=Sciurus carolinensis TaxID=30640 RepID=UPI001FB30A10|nr:uncharacterized protein LOC124984967 [Sciurus carolinensis]XP_047409153.1 uncharacterized protein LOC124984967 [Sciurus carolinensis]XP_047409154.1 uncharacterized protein LOC124984967 [Sciurus carolinensis]XP_047409155.1 uncharacterized protein LOC124984967 [Sciurus carolinensis]XP_047409156.1 uncharacterized protein LOC124984967 [Sciurus carolinensis]XP_047409157.1 uncharacterized protein LOC124984967 [Sciurus carolinensis]XP_047409158.1 uncharacterized protein LOC124984967 [Sciurus caro
MLDPRKTALLPSRGLSMQTEASWGRTHRCAEGIGQEGARPATALGTWQVDSGKWQAWPEAAGDHVLSGPHAVQCPASLYPEPCKRSVLRAGRGSCGGVVCPDRCAPPRAPYPGPHPSTAGSRGPHLQPRAGPALAEARWTSVGLIQGRATPRGGHLLGIKAGTRLLPEPRAGPRAHMLRPAEGEVLYLFDFAVVGLEPRASLRLGEPYHPAAPSPVSILYCSLESLAENNLLINVAAAALPPGPAHSALGWTEAHHPPATDGPERGARGDLPSRSWVCAAPGSCPQAWLCQVLLHAWPSCYHSLRVPEWTATPKGNASPTCGSLQHRSTHVVVLPPTPCTLALLGLHSSRCPTPL